LAAAILATVLFSCLVAVVANSLAGRTGRHPAISQGEANAIAVAAIAESQPGAAGWIVTHSDLHPVSVSVSDVTGSPRFGSSWVACPIAVVEERLRLLGLGCPPPPVWAVEVSTTSRPTYHRALVEIDALTGKVLAWQVDDSLP
jgi:hypothetical protein